MRYHHSMCCSVSVDKESEQLELPCPSDGDVKWYNPAIPILRVYPREIKAYAHTRTCTPMFCQNRPKKRKHSKCPSAAEQLNKLIYSYSRMLFSKNKIKRGNSWYTEQCRQKQISGCLSMGGSQQGWMGRERSQWAQGNYWQWFYGYLCLV